MSMSLRGGRASGVDTRARTHTHSLDGEVDNGSVLLNKEVVLCEPLNRRNSINSHWSHHVSCTSTRPGLSSPYCNTYLDAQYEVGREAGQFIALHK